MMAGVGSADRSLLGRIGAYTTHSRHSGHEMTRAAREAFASKFELEVDPDGVLEPAERARRAEMGGQKRASAPTSRRPRLLVVLRPRGALRPGAPGPQPAGHPNLLESRLPRLFRDDSVSTSRQGPGRWRPCELRRGAAGSATTALV